MREKYNVAVAGATGNVGREIIKILEQRDFPINDLYVLASSRSKGKKINFRDKDLTVKYNINKDKQYLIDNPQRRCPSILKAKKLLKYNPKIGLDEGLRRTYQYYLDHPIDEDL